MILEHVDRRVLGAVIFIDATTRLRVTSPLEIEGRGVRFVRNRRAIYVVTGAPGLQSYTEAFGQQPAVPAAGAVPLESIRVELRISDPSFQYVPRRFGLRLPRDPNAANADQAGSLFRPIEVQLFPSPASSVAPGWALIRATVLEAETNSRLPWSLLRVMSTDDDPRVLALGLADNRGEALVAVPGIPITTFGDADEVVATEIDVALEIVFDPDVQPLEDLEALRAGEDPNEGYVPDPDALNGEEASDSFDLTLASGRVLTETLLVDLSP